MLKEMIEKILSLAPIQTIKHDGRTYTKSGVHQIKPPSFTDPARLDFHTLTGMVNYIKDDERTGALIIVNDHSQISLCGPLQPDNNNKRFIFAASSLVSNPFDFGRWYDLETFIIALQSQFVYTDEVGNLLDHLGHLANEHVIDNKDDGLSQSIQVRTGITTKSSVTIKNPMTFEPYRTFMEIEQPASQHIFRMRNQNGMQCTLVEGDGGKWKLDAIQGIKAWLSEKLPDMTIIA